MSRIFLIAAAWAALLVQPGAASVWVVVLTLVIKALLAICTVTVSVVGVLFLRRRRPSGAAIRPT